MAFLFGKPRLIEWEEYRDDVIFWKWQGTVRRRNRILVKPGQDAVFLNDGKLDGIYQPEGNYQIRSKIRGKGEVIFINTRDFTMTWGTKNALLVPFPGFTGGVPIRAFGTYILNVDEMTTLLDTMAGTRKEYTVEDVRLRVDSMLDQLLMKWITEEGNDLFTLQNQADRIAKGIQDDLDMELLKIGLTIHHFKISSFSYPKEIQARINAAASEKILYANERTQAPSPAGLYCPYCGAEVKPTDRFCANCGKKL
ncbi:MAG: SPFH domain-containing protein [Firmicutes bacterium]|nr:SPFH domain-containing protein [Bacillota bacterium]